MWIVHFR
jgi:hypothetical protein